MSDFKTVRIGAWTFKWYGGAYIDIYHPAIKGHAVDCINVWDYEKNESTIPHTSQALRREGKEWLEGNKDWLDDLINGAS